MGWKENCLAALDAAKLFENSGHRTRFKELMDCYSNYPFFTKGLCKCMYLSAWDDEHFAVMLETLMDMSLGREQDTKDMQVKGDALAEERNDGEYYVYLLSGAFLEDKPYILPEDADIPQEIRYIIDRAIRASAVIDEVFCLW